MWLGMAQDLQPLKMRSDLVQALISIGRKEVEGEDARQLLGSLLQTALNLEFATIPPYLSAAFSLGETNEEILHLIIRAAKEEMLHMTVVANLMNAIGISPDLVQAAPDYPYEMDMLESDLEVYLSSFSFDLIENLFMRIEAPEDPVAYAIDQEPETIGQFYAKIIEIIRNDIIPDLFKDAKANEYKQIKAQMSFTPIRYQNNEDQNTYPLLEGMDFIITNKEAAIAYLEWVVGQGEGADKNQPLTAEGIPGHYYRFESILKGKYLIFDIEANNNHSYSGGDIPFTPEGVSEFDNNAKIEDYSEYRRVTRHMKRFNSRYTEMIDYLQAAFNCTSPSDEDVTAAQSAYKASLGSMRNMDGIAKAIIREAAASEIKAGIPFQYMGSNLSA